MPFFSSINAPVNGAVSPGFEPVKAEFIKNFTKRKELGAACTIYHKSQKIVDLWGGYQDKDAAQHWNEDTLILVFSTTKGMSALALAHAHSNGLFNLDAPVSDYWQEFSQNGKDKITVRQLISHQGGLCALDRQMSLDDLSNPDKMADILSQQKPAWETGTKHGYHGMTIGWYESELMRRVDPESRCLGQYFKDEIAQPLGLEFYIGCPKGLDESRIADIRDFHPAQLLLHLHEMPFSFVKAMMKKGSLTARTFGTPKVNRPGDFCKKEFREVEIPAGNGIGTVRSIAKAYSEFACGGSKLGINQETLDELTASPTTPMNGPFDEVFRVNTAFSMGFMKPFQDFQFGSSQTFGTPGFGGSFGFADPDNQIGYAYAPNRSGFKLWDDPRDLALRKALNTCLEAQTN